MVKYSNLARLAGLGVLVGITNLLMLRLLQKIEEGF